MQPMISLDTQELTSWLTRITQSVDRSLRDPVRAEVVRTLADGLEPGTRPSLPVLAQVAFLADCLRVAHLAIDADGRADAAELERVADLVALAAQKYFCALPAYEAFGEGADDPRDAWHFLRVHREDPGPFGWRRSEAWRGLALARRVERETTNASPLREHERMLVRVMDAVFAGRHSDVERTARRRLRDLFEQPTAAPGSDPRATAFCRSDGPEVFSSVAHGSQFHERDAFDVETIHADARAVFHQQVERATTPEHAQRGHGRTLLVLGESGAGKTHLLRALRTQVHAQRLGYVGYLQMSADVDDYARYVLRSVVDSLEHPYDAPSLIESALMYLSDGLVESRVQIAPDDIERLRNAELERDQLERLVGSLVDRVVRTEGLEQLEGDLVQALLLLQRRDPALQRRIVRFLRCEPLNGYDRAMLGGLAARERGDDPLRTLRGLATLMHELQLAALVIVVDQVEEIAHDGSATRLQRALDALRAIADSIPSAVIVISCLENVYEAVRPKLTQSLVDRLERDPGPVRLDTRRQPAEIEQMLVRRLEHLYASFDVAWRDDDPLFPFSPAQIEAVAQLRARDCLGQFRDYHAACIAAQQLVGLGGVVVPPPPPPGVDYHQLLVDTIAGLNPPPDDDAQVLAVIGDALRDAAGELGRSVHVSAAASGTLLVEGPDLPRRLIALCNHGPQRGRLGIQLAALRDAATRAGAIPIALRSGDFKFQPKTKSAQQVGELLSAGGRVASVTEGDLRLAAALRRLGSAPPDGFAAWRQAAQPTTGLGFLRVLLDTDRVVAAPPPPVPRPEPPKPEPTPSAETGAIPVLVDPAAVRLGVVDSMRAEPIALQLEAIKTHVAFLGSTGSGKTTAALAVVEQLLERGVSVLLVDRKGDLSRYVSEAWWSEPSDPPEVRQRKRALRQRIDVALYTPGNSQGRPLRLPLVPSLADAPKQDRDQLARFAAEGLANMMGYGKSAAHQAKRSILQVAISLHGEERDISLDLLRETISRPDPELLHQVDNLQRHFAALSEDLQTLKIQRGALLSGDGELLDVGAMLPPTGSPRARLTIINTAALTEVPVLQFWVSRLLIDIARLGRKRPSQTLQAAVFFDEADSYIPAISAPPTKEPMFDLLRRSRSTGIGVLLATQNPGDLDYKARDNIGTWLLGRIAQDHAIGKMRNLIGAYPDVGPRLASQRTGSFFLLTSSSKREIRADRALMETAQLAEAEVAELARATA